jgi:2-dehydro-3-deoxyphosphogluconate aldolase / (4S)-4-hydroxy-2-oxoglutarate aldolase
VGKVSVFPLGLTRAILFSTLITIQKQFEVKKMTDIMKKIGEIRLVPVVKIENVKDAVPLAKALVAGGLPVAEVTFRTDAAEEAIRSISHEVPEVVLGAGTVLTIDQVKRAWNAGAGFMVSPGFNPKVVDYCVKKNIPITPGVNSPTQVEMGLERGLTLLKFFPAEASGGLAMLNALGAPYGSVQYIPTGGIGPKNLKDYLANKFVFAVGGSWMVKADMISGGKFDEIATLSREAVDLVKS